MGYWPYLFPIWVALLVVNLLKGKYLTAIFGSPVVLIVLVGAIRLAKPGSMWAKWFYRGRWAHKQAAADARYARDFA